MKIKNNRGSAMVLAIIATFLVSIIVVLMSKQIINVIRMNSNSYTGMQAKYSLEAGIEKTIGEVVTKIEKEYSELLSENNVSLSYPNGAVPYGGGKSASTSFDIDIDNIKPVSLSNINYKINSPINIVLTITLQQYAIMDKNNNPGEIYTVIDEENTNIDITQNIVVSTEVDNKKYQSESQINFKIIDTYSNSVSYSALKWNDMKVID